MLRKSISIIAVIAMIFTITACDSTSSKPNPPRKSKNPPRKTVVIKPANNNSSQNSSLSIEQKLRRAAKEWYGTPHRMGGVSKRGIDCSGLVMTLYRDVLGVKMPRTTTAQSKRGRKISRKNLRPGDLILFKTGWGKQHSGIYLGKGEFVHTSSKRGVMISSIYHDYWDDAYWMSRRIID